METLFVTLTLSVLAIATLASEALKRVINTDKKWVNDLASWIVSIGLTYAAWFIGFLPAASQPEWFWILLQGIIVGLAASGLYGKDIIKKFYDWVFSWINGAKWYVNDSKEPNAKDA